MVSPWGGSSTLRCGNTRAATYSAFLYLLRRLDVAHSENKRTIEFRLILYIPARLAEFFT
jgi:hypothetical protein